MPRKDFYHETVKRALQRDGWTITADPLNLPFGSTRLECDLAAEKMVATKGLVEIAVEVKNFRKEEQMNVNELKNSLGQYQLYDVILSTEHPNHRLYLAISEQAYKTVFSDPVIQVIINRNNMGLIIFDSTTETIVTWKH